MSSPTAANWVAENTSTIGTGNIVLNGAEDGEATFAATIDAGRVWYSVRDGNNYEAGYGTYDGANTIERTDIHATLVGGVYVDDAPGPITLTGVGVVQCTFNSKIFRDLITHMETTGNPHGTLAVEVPYDPTLDTLSTSTNVQDALLDHEDAITNNTTSINSNVTDISSLGVDVINNADAIALKEDGLGNPAVDNYILSSTIAGVRSWKLETGAGGGGMTDLIDDTTPQLGGNLDVNAKSIFNSDGINPINVSSDLTVLSTTGIGNDTTVIVQPDTGGTTGRIVFNKANGDNGGIIKLVDAQLEIEGITNPVKIDGLLYPSADGTAGQVIKTDGVGTLSFADSVISVDGSSGVIDLSTSYTPITHSVDYTNPHAVTATQVGLGNVDNTADADKPVSTATQTALDEKMDALHVFNSNTNVDAPNTNEIRFNHATVASVTGIGIDMSGATDYIATFLEQGYTTGIITIYSASSLTRHTSFEVTNLESLPTETVGNYYHFTVNTFGNGTAPVNGAEVWMTFAASAAGTVSLGAVIDDTTPQLGGNLDVNGKSITSVSAGNISIVPDTTGTVILDGLNWPQADGSINQVLKTDGAGNLAFVDQTTDTDTDAFVGLTDTPADFSGAGDNIVAVNTGATALEYIASLDGGTY